MKVMATDAKLTAQIVNLYAGRPVRIQTGGVSTIISAFTTQAGSTVLCSTGTDPYQRHTGLNPYYTNERSFKPILRPLSSIGLLEAEHCYRLRFGFPFEIHDRQPYILDAQDWFLGCLYHNKDTNPCANLFSAAEVLYLCSLGFDLFGLIDAGLAIDTTTIKSPNP